MVTVVHGEGKSHTEKSLHLLISLTITAMKLKPMYLLKAKID